MKIKFILYILIICTICLFINKYHNYKIINNCSNIISNESMINECVEKLTWNNNIEQSYFFYEKNYDFHFNNIESQENFLLFLQKLMTECEKNKINCINFDYGKRYSISYNNYLLSTMYQELRIENEIKNCINNKNCFLDNGKFCSEDYKKIINSLPLKFKENIVKEKDFCNGNYKNYNQKLLLFLENSLTKDTYEEDLKNKLKLLKNK